MKFSEILDKAEPIFKVALPFLKAAVILVVGHFIIVYLLKLCSKAFKKANLDPSLERFLVKTLNIVLHVLILLSALSAVGISITGLIAAFSAAAVAIALALKDSLGNIAGGILLLVAPRFATGDFVEIAGQSGSVKDVDLLHTTLVSPDKREIIVPNGVLINSQIVNYSSEPERRVDLSFAIAYESDPELAKKIILDTALAHPKVLKETDKAPFARVGSYGDSAVNITTRVWSTAADYWDVYFDLLEQVRAELEKGGIKIPYNQIEVHINQK